MEMKCIFNTGKNISIWAKVTQVSDVAHGPFDMYHNGLHFVLVLMCIVNVWLYNIYLYSLSVIIMY
jgi:hypothetical protein